MHRTNALRRAWRIANGTLVDVGGYRLRVQCLGSGEPTVVMDSGLDADRYTWGIVPGNVSRFARVCTYDRAGIGESDAGAHPRTSQQIVQEFDRLLKNAKIPSPYILVGHSFGGINMRLYASQHPDTIVGLVLVDASQEDQFERSVKFMTPDEQAEDLQHECGNNEEGVDVLASYEQVRNTHLSPSLLLTVLSAENDYDCSEQAAAQLHLELQAKLAQLVPAGELVIVKNTGHWIQNDQPQVVIQAIEDMVNEACRLKSKRGNL